MVTDASTAPTTDISTEDKRRMLLGGDDSLQSCLSSAEGQVRRTYSGSKSSCPAARTTHCSLVHAGRG